MYRNQVVCPSVNDIRKLHLPVTSIRAFLLHVSLLVLFYLFMFTGYFSLQVCLTGKVLTRG